MVPLAPSEHPVLGNLYKLYNRTCPFAEGNMILGFGLSGEKKSQNKDMD